MTSGSSVERFHSDAMAVGALSGEVAALPPSTSTGRFLRFAFGRSPLTGGRADNASVRPRESHYVYTLWPIVSTVRIC